LSGDFIIALAPSSIEEFPSFLAVPHPSPVSRAYRFHSPGVIRKFAIPGIAGKSAARINPGSKVQTQILKPKHPGNQAHIAKSQTLRRRTDVALEFALFPIKQGACHAPCGTGTYLSDYKAVYKEERVPMSHYGQVVG
jgi:hypothetical protein